MLRQIISITGKPGLFKIVSHSNRNIIVEDLISKKRFPVSMRDKLVSLGDIAMYTDSGDKPLSEILDLLYANRKGEKIDVKSLSATGDLRPLFREVIPDFDEDRVYDNDIKKLFNWYNILTEAGFTEFSAKEEEENKEASEEAEQDNKA
ncbi:MAG: DUF5606 domain-containing protein [Muribaculum sp.]|nr:DUF5606 domain-containing protein [Muribaculum sp.]